MNTHNVHAENEILRRRLSEIASGAVHLPQRHAAEGLAEANGAASEALKMITVRLPESLHEALKNAAHERQVSLNTLCVRALQLETETTPAPERNLDATATVD